MKFKKPVAIIAAHNEQGRIKAVIKEAKKHVSLVIVVDDGSKDKTLQEALDEGAAVLHHITNLGKGGAMKTGAEYAIRQNADALIFIDGDGQHEPHEIPRFLKALEKHDIVFGRRVFGGDMPFLLRFGNWFISQVIYYLYGLMLHDSQCGYRAVRSSKFSQIVWDSKDYSVESEMIAWAGKANLAYEEIKIKTIYYDKFKGTTPMHGFPIVWNLFMWRFHRRGGGIC